jgi:GNAT superfamily N-acetyltransferase
MIRLATVADADALLSLMRQLAEFEGYADRFHVTAGELIARGLGPQSANQFVAWVAEEEGVLSGYAVVYSVPFTFDLRPTIVIKELFVLDAKRGSSSGASLFAAVVDFSHTQNARLLRWQVLPSNHRAQQFYRREGGVRDEGWESWLLELDQREG